MDGMFNTGIVDGICTQKRRDLGSHILGQVQIQLLIYFRVETGGGPQDDHGLHDSHNQQEHQEHRREFAIKCVEKGFHDSSSSRSANR